MEISIPKGWCCLFRGDVHHCGAAYGVRNDRLHFYMRPSPTRKRKRADGNNIFNVSSTRIAHTIRLDNDFFGVAVRGKKIYFLIKTCTKGVTLYWEWRKYKINNNYEKALEKLCRLVHKKQKKTDSPNIRISELENNIEVLKEVCNNYFNDI